MVIPSLPALLARTLGPSLLFTQFLCDAGPVVEAVLSDEIEDGMVLLDKNVPTSTLHDCLLIAYNI